MLLDMPMVKSMLDDLRKQFQVFDTTHSYSDYLACCDLVDEWKFSDGDYFGHLPYSDERMGFSSPRLMKRKYANVDEARWLGKYGAGFAFMIASNIKLKILKSASGGTSFDFTYNGEATVDKILAAFGKNQTIDFSNDGN